MGSKKVLSVTMLKMFEEEVNNLFKPLMAEAKAREQIMEQEIEVAARKELGIYDLSVEVAKVELHLEELKRRLKEYTSTQRINGEWISPLMVKKEELRERMYKGTFVRKVHEAKAEIVRDIRLAALGEDIANLIRKVIPERVEALNNELKSLPAPKKPFEIEAFAD